MSELLTLQSSQAHAPSILSVLDLNVERVHSIFYRGMMRASARNSLSLPGSAGTDLYHDGMQDLHSEQSQRGWRLVTVNGQPRVVHPENEAAIVIAAAEGLVGDRNGRRVQTRRPKGSATIKSINGQRFDQPMLFGSSEFGKDEQETLDSAPLWMLLHEWRDQVLYLAVAKPNGYSPGRIVNTWSHFESMPALVLDGGISLEDYSLYGGEEEEYDVPVALRKE